jgi:hypothetical protein
MRGRSLTEGVDTSIGSEIDTSEPPAPLEVVSIFGDPTPNMLRVPGPTAAAPS